MRACQCTKYTNKHRETCTLLISRGRKQNYKIPLHMRSVACWRGRHDLGDCEVLVHGASESSRLITSASQSRGPPPIKLLQRSSSSSRVFSNCSMETMV